MNWISILDNLPPNNKYVLVSMCMACKDNPFYYVRIAKRLNSEWFDDHNQDKIEDKKTVVTHWQSLPDDASKTSFVNNQKKVTDTESNMIATIYSHVRNMYDHVINLNIAFQNHPDKNLLEQFIRHTSQPFKIDYVGLKKNLEEAKDEMQKVCDDFNKGIEKLSNLNSETSLSELKFISKHIFETKCLLDEIKVKGIDKKIDLRFECDGYELVKKPIDYDPVYIEKSKYEKDQEILNTLPKREAEAVKHYLGLIGETKRTFNELGEILGVTRERASLIYKKAIRKLRNSRRIELVKKSNNYKIRLAVLGEI